MAVSQTEVKNFPENAELLVGTSQPVATDSSDFGEYRRSTTYRPFIKCDAGPGYL